MLVNPRTYGREPFRTVVVHGGPGAPGEMAPVARELSDARGVLEPLQTVSGAIAQVRELASLVQLYGRAPVHLIGWSWGAWLSFILASQYPDLVAKLILVGSPPFEEHFAQQITAQRLERLSPEGRSEALGLMNSLEDPTSNQGPDAMRRLHDILVAGDSYELLPRSEEVLGFQLDIYQETWPEAAELRRSGRLLEMGKSIRCPVLALHGDFDPHPAEGVREPLSRVLTDFRLLLLLHCGHYPWFERAAREEFFSILNLELRFPS